MGQSPDSKSYNQHNEGIPLVQGNADITDRITSPLRFTNNPSMKRCNPGDTLISVRAPVGTVSKSNIYACIGRGIASLGNINEYLYQFFLSKESSWSKYAQGSTFTCITANDIENILIGLPSAKEQEKIGHFLQKLDNRILTQKKIINYYKSLINGLIKMYFSNKGLCEVGKTIALNDILIEGNKIPVDTKQYPKITIKLNKEGIAFSNLNREMADTRPFYIRNKNEIIIGKQNYFNGSIAIIPEEYDNTICSNAIMSFKVKKDFNLKFIYYSISNDSFLKYRSHLANGTGQKELSEKDFLSFKIILPDECTQNRIVNNIEKISEKLQLEKKILFLYEQQKQYLLDKLFI